MRSLSTLSVFLIAVACSARPVDDSGDPDRLDPAGQSSLQGREVVATDEGPWMVRRTHRTAEREASSAGTVMERSLEAEGADSAEIDYARPGADDPAPSGKAGLTADFELHEEYGAPVTSLTISDSRDGDAGSARIDYAPLRAGSTDDNAEFEEFVQYLAGWRQREGVAWADLDVSDRRSIRVVDAEGAPLPGVELQIIDEAADRVAWRGTTYGDGRCPFYPQATGTDGDVTGPYLIEVRQSDRTFREHWDGQGDEFTLTVREPTEQPDETVLDVVFLIDTTGSMGDEIDRIKGTLLSVTDRLRSLELEFDLRYGAVLYRDVGDEYLTKNHPFTSDIEAFDKALQQIEAGGGGDGPESLNQGLAVAVDGMEWRAGAARLMFLIADAPPHMDYEGDVPYDGTLRRAVAQGIRIHSVAASGLDGAGSLVFRQIAQFTRGEFVFIEYGGSTPDSAAGHGVTGDVSSNNLDAILFARIRDEIARWGRV